MLDSAAGDSGGAASVASPDVASPATPSPSASASTSTTTGTDGLETPKGPIPYERFDEINRKYTALKWAETHDPAKVSQQAQFFQWLDADPVGAFKYMESHLARAGLLKRPQRPANGNGQGDGRPQPDIVVPETGQRFYSAEAAEKLASWHAQQSVAPINERLNSFEADRQRSKAAEAAAAQLQEAESWPHYTEHATDILKEMQRDGRLSLEGAYRRVVVPKIRELERQTVLSELKAKSGASTASPQSTTSSQTVPTSKMGWGELFRRELAKRNGR